MQLYHEAWDQHTNLTHDLAENCRNTDRASAALILDLKQRGLLKDTIVIWGGEFGRTPMVQGGSDGRDHQPTNAFTMWMTGGGIKAGARIGETDDLGFNVAEKTRSIVYTTCMCDVVEAAGVRPHQAGTYKSGGSKFPVNGCER